MNNTLLALSAGR